MLKLTKTPSDIAFTPYSHPKKRIETEAFYDRKWRLDPESLNPLATAEGESNLERFWSLLAPSLKPGSSLLDLGTGSGVLAKRCAQSGVEVTAVDIAQLPLAYLKDIPHLTPRKEWVPYTKLPEASFDIVIAHDLMASLPPIEYRLFLVELIRLVKKQGWIFLSTPLDIYTEDPLLSFLELIGQELIIHDTLISHHNLHLKLTDAFKKMHLPQLSSFLKKSKTSLKLLEKASSFLDEEDASYVIIKAKIKPLDFS